MNKALKLITLFIVPACSSYAQTTAVDAADTMYTMQLKTVNIKARWLNDTDRYHYNQMKFYVTTILPYLNAATKLFNEVNDKLEHEDLSRKERKAFIASKEEVMRTQFEDKVKALNVTQGALLVKLIARQTDANIYRILQDFKNPFVALKWQAWARMNGMNLDRKYHPEEERDLENIMEELGYPLPASYVLSGN
jgi:hypothetical protein